MHIVNSRNPKMELKINLYLICSGCLKKDLLYSETLKHYDTKTTACFIIPQSDSLLRNIFFVGYVTLKQDFFVTKHISLNHSVSGF